MWKPKTAALFHLDPRRRPLEKGRNFLDQFRAAPDAAEWQSATTDAARKRKEEARADAKRGSNVITRERMDYERNYTGFAWVPLVLCIISIAVTIWAGELGSCPRATPRLIVRIRREREAQSRRANGADDDHQAATANPRQI
jgi:hypothetical protein